MLARSLPALLTARQRSVQHCKVSLQVKPGYLLVGLSPGSQKRDIKRSFRHLQTEIRPSNPGDEPGHWDPFQQVLKSGLRFHEETSRLPAETHIAVNHAYGLLPCQCLRQPLPGEGP